MRRFALLSAAAALAVPASHALAQPTLSPTFADVAYGDGHPRQVLDVYIPPGPPAVRPCVVWIHGGGWQNGDKAAAATRARPLMGLGFVVVGINYRLSGTDAHPAQIHDCKGAIRFLRAHAGTYGIDPARIGVWGSSAGGHLAALVGTSGDVAALEGAVGGNLAHSSRVQAVADYFGPADFLSVTLPGHLACDSPESRMLGLCLGQVIANQDDPAWADEVATVLAASPTTHASPDDPPFAIAHGTADPVVQMQQSQALHAALIDAGATASLRLVPGAGHGLPPIEDIPTRRFLAASLGVTVCPGDFNASGAVGVQDVFDFLEAFFQEHPIGDFNQSGAISTQDIFDFLAAYFGAC